MQSLFMMIKLEVAREIQEVVKEMSSKRKE
jgi:hypothetical protein